MNNFDILTNASTAAILVFVLLATFVVFWLFSDPKMRHAYRVDKEFNGIDAIEEKAFRAFYIDRMGIIRYPLAVKDSAGNVLDISYGGTTDCMLDIRLNGITSYSEFLVATGWKRADNKSAMDELSQDFLNMHGRTLRRYTKSLFDQAMKDWQGKNAS